MRVLWLCNQILPIIANHIKTAHSNYGGWLDGLYNDAAKCENINFIICFPQYNNREMVKGIVDNLKYYGFPQNVIDPTKYNTSLHKYFSEIIIKELPDIIHIFGTEFPHTLCMVNVCKKLNIESRVVINIQGLCSIIAKHYMIGIPSKICNSYTFRDFIKNDNINLQQRKFIKRGKHEIEAIRSVKHVIGRTTWDKACTLQINPNLEYHFCNETLREIFYKHRWDINNCEKYTIFLSQASYPLKGFHFLLEAMVEIIKWYPFVHIYTTGKSPLSIKGVKDRLKINSYQKYITYLIKKYKLQKNITFLGDLDDQQMCSQYLKSHVFVSSSSIENSPNSVGEAMLLGLPIVSSDVGGVRDILTHNLEGFTYQVDATYMLAYYILKIFNDDELAIKISVNARIHALNTHDKKININRLLTIYNQIGGIFYGAL